MPAVSKKQRIVAAIAEHHPEQLYARNRGMLSMTKGQLHEFAATKEKGLPPRKRLSQSKRRMRDRSTMGSPAMSTQEIGQGYRRLS